MVTQREWDRRNMAIAKEVSSWSKDPSTKVGAVIVDALNRPISWGYNGYPRGVADRNYEDREFKYLTTIHAEKNAILNCRVLSDLEGSTLYCTSLHPCSLCAADIIQTGIKRVVYMTDRHSDRWQISVERAKDMFHEAGVVSVLFSERNL